MFAALELPFLPTYNDFQFKVKHKLNDKNELTIIGLGALDQFELNTKANQTVEQRYILKYLPVNEQWNYTLGAVYKRYRENGYNSLILSHNYLNNKAFKHINNVQDSAKTFDYSSQEQEVKLRYETVTNLPAGFKLGYGASAEYAKYTNSTFNIVANKAFTDTLLYYTSLNMFHYGSYVQLSNKLFNQSLTLSTGLRIDGTNYSSAMNNPFNHVSPRLSASYQLSNKISLNASSGRYFQRPPYTAMGFRDNNQQLVNQQNGLSYITADHLVAGLEYLPNEQSSISLEGFIKSTRTTPTQ
ncbi:MAG: TonB-dependent receptor [Bacteroidales bacterium]|nr:TonB-dependent receptor [Bacteroidales bacterium]